MHFMFRKGWFCQFLEQDLKAHAAQPVKFIVSHRPSWILNALVGDTNSGVRMLALRLAEPMKTDSNVRSVLTRVSRTDQNVSIRSQAHTMLAQMPEMD